MSGRFLSDESEMAITVRSTQEPQPPPAVSLNDYRSTGAADSPAGSFANVAPKSDRYPRQQKTQKGKARTTHEAERHLPEARYSLRQLWGRAQAKAAEMVLASRSDDPVELSNSASDLDQILGQMWDLREYRETEWRGVLNFVQGVMKYLWKISGGFEQLSLIQCEAIGEIVKHHLGPSTMDKEDVRSTLKLLKTAGIDAWDAISRDQQE